MADVEGTADVLARLEKIEKQVLAATKANMRSVAKQLLSEAQEQVPVQTGELRDSGYVRQVGHVSYIGFTAPHAARNHERLDLKHPRGNAKFLERPLRDEVPHFDADISEGINL